ncbi:TetR family transcriptional regulator [Streptomyces sp. NPDC060184]|uniref:TetR family transcriptional regulator n=1 Tax=Streptomyces sp. NPDC060184 TaxID=3347064 RepID=UPI0036590F7B
MQERAAHTRGALIESAAAEFERAGYDGASLARISSAARASVGALTFHFRTKAALADAVCAASQAGTALLVSQALTSPEPPLVALRHLVTGLTRLVETSVVARAAARLRHELPGVPVSASPALDWPVALTLLVKRARRAGSLREGVAPEVAETLVHRFIEGTGVHVRGLARSGSAGLGATAEQLWELLEHSIAKIPDGREKIPDGRGKTPDA